MKNFNLHKTRLYLFMCCVVISMFAFEKVNAQLFRQFAPLWADRSNRLSCVITLGANSGFLGAGEYIRSNTNGFAPISAHDLWFDFTNIGYLTDQRNFNREAYEDYSAHGHIMIEQQQTNGSLTATPPYQNYSGHPVVGYKVRSEGFPIREYRDTWVSVLNPTTKNLVWNHTITDGDGRSCYGKSVVVDHDNPRIFYVLSQIVPMDPPQHFTFAVTKYMWTPGYAGHQVIASYEYSLPDYDLFVGGMDQAVGATVNNGKLIVVGTMVNTVSSIPSKVFTIKVMDGATNFNIYQPTYCSYCNIKANSIVWNEDKDAFVVAGATTYQLLTDAGDPETTIDDVYTSYSVPMLLSVPANLTPNTGDCKLYKAYRLGIDRTNGEFLDGEFTYAKRRTAGGDYPIFAVGTMYDNMSSVQRDACAIRVDDLDAGGLPTWITLQGEDFSQLGATQTSPYWFDWNDETDLGSIFYVGKQVQLANANRQTAIGGIVLQGSGYTTCNKGAYNEIDVEDLDLSTTQVSASISEWGIDENYVVSSTTPDMEKKDCFAITWVETILKQNDNSHQIIPGLMESNTEIQYTNSMIIVNHNAQIRGSLEIVLLDLLGNIIARETFSVDAGKRQFTYRTEALISGTYIVAVKTEDSSISKQISVLH